MNPHQKNKIDVNVCPQALPCRAAINNPQALSADEQRLFRLYGKLPNKKDLLQNKLKVRSQYATSTPTSLSPTDRAQQERKYFDSGDYALSKAGKASDTGVTSIGTEHPTADAIPHMSPLTNTITRGDSVSTGSPPGSLSSPGGAGSGPGGQEGMPAGLHRGSINGIPGGGLPGHASSHSPVKESSYLARSASVDEGAQEGSGANTITTGAGGKAESMSPPPKREGIPIRR
jgi:hypothetical protein